MPSPNFTNDYADNGKELRAASRAEAGHRCIRCGHPYPPMKREDRGEWSVCDEQCTHAGEVRVSDNYPYDPWEHLTFRHVVVAMIKPSSRFPNRRVEARWRILTVHHFDGDKANDAWWNHLSLCQRCHLSFQTKVNPEIPFMFPHSDWLKPYVAGFYAKKYLGLDLTREQVAERLEELLKLECRVS